MVTDMLARKGLASSRSNSHVGEVARATGSSTAINSTTTHEAQHTGRDSSDTRIGLAFLRLALAGSLGRGPMSNVTAHAPKRT